MSCSLKLFNQNTLEPRHAHMFYILNGFPVVVVKLCDLFQ